MKQEEKICIKDEQTILGQYCPEHCLSKLMSESAFSNKHTSATKNPGGQGRYAEFQDQSLSSNSLLFFFSKNSSSTLSKN